MFKGAGVDFFSCSSGMSNPLRRYYGRGDLHYITFSCYRRRSFLGTARHRFAKILDAVRSRYKFLLIGYVVMPEHVHLLMKLTLHPHTQNRRMRHPDSSRNLSSVLSKAFSVPPAERKTQA